VSYSLLAFWIGGAGSPATITQAGYRTPLPLPINQGAVTGVPTTRAGYSSLLAFWAGGAANSGIIPPALERLADPYVGPARTKHEKHPPGWEPFDLGYFKTKYGKLREPESKPVLIQDLSQQELAIDLYRLEQYLLNIELKIQRDKYRAIEQQNYLDALDLLAEVKRLHLKKRNEIAVITATMFFYFNGE